MYGLLSTTKNFIKNLKDLNNQEKLEVFKIFKNRFIDIFTEDVNIEAIKKGEEVKFTRQVDEVKEHLSGYEKVLTQIDKELKKELGGK